jgi:hypothetical protein
MQTTRREFLTAAAAAAGLVAVPLEALGSAPAAAVSAPIALNTAGPLGPLAAAVDYLLDAREGAARRLAFDRDPSALLAALPANDAQALLTFEPRLWTARVYEALHDNGAADSHIGAFADWVRRLATWPIATGDGPPRSA